MTLESELEAHIRPQATVYVDEHAHAAVRALCRVFHGRPMALHVVAMRAGDLVPDLLAAGIVGRLTTASLVGRHGDPAKVAVLQELLGGAVAYEAWSLFTLCQRLTAGALGLPFAAVPAGVAETGWARENPESVACVGNPFGGGTSWIVAPLVPDVALVHAALAAPSGHAVVPPPHADAGWGARAARGVIVTAERIVPEAAMRRHAALVRIPPGRVLAVRERRHGAYPHEFPTGNDSLNVGYLADSAALRVAATARRTAETHRRWLAESVTGRSEAEFLADAGPDRLRELELAAVRARRTGARAPTASARPRTAPAPAHSPAAVPLAELSGDDRIALVVARRIVAGVLAGQVRAVLVGNGPPGRACAIAQHLLRVRGVAAPEFVIGTGLLGVALQTPGRAARIASAGALSDPVDAYGVVLGGAGALGILSAAQVDRFGRTNTSRLPGEPPRILAGSGGAGDAAALAGEIVLACRYRTGRFVPEVDFVTTSGARVSTVVTDFGVLTRDPGDPHGELALTGSLLPPDETREYLRRIAGERGWVVPVGDAPPVAGATRDELRAISRLNPERKAGT